MHACKLSHGMTGGRDSHRFQSFPMKSSFVIGVLNRPKVPSTAALWPSAEVAAQQSVSVTTLKPFSQAVRMVLSTQQFVRKPPRTTVLMPCFTSIASKFVPGKASRPRFPWMTTSPSTGVISFTISEFHVPSVKRAPSAHPLRMPKFLLGLSLLSALKLIGVWKILQPFSRAFAVTSALFSSMPVLAMTSFTPSCSFPPSEQNSFWYSIMTKAVLEASMASPPLASAGAKVRPSCEG
mmetsp:Transcript_91694/g.243643  ORF Transcript_91694/g.243643 Transcript_91694/m.243643 type:complete len:237 (+) Transcript_91694:188-898(+)